MTPKMTKKNWTRADTWSSQTQLGILFAMSSVAVGKKLTELGLKGVDKKPTEKAIASGYCRTTTLKGGTPFYLWHRQDVAALFRAAGLEQLSAEDAEAFASARSLVAAARDAHKSGIDQIFCLMVDDIPSAQYDRVNRHLQGIGSALRLWQ